MIGTLATALADRTPREKLLLALMAVAALPAALWFLWAAPLLDARTDAAATLAEARALRQWVAARDAEFAALGGTAAAATPAGVAGIERALQDAGLRGAVQRLENGPDGRVLVEFANVSFRDLMAFADATDALSYRVASFRLDAAGTPGNVSARLDLAPLP